MNQTLLVASSDCTDVRHPSVNSLGFLADGSDPWAAAIERADGMPGPILLSRGRYRVERSINIDDVVMQDGAVIVPDADVTVTISGTFRAGLHKCFDLSAGGTIAFTSAAQLYPQWWGAVGDSVTNDQAAIQAAITAAQGARSKVVLIDPGGGNGYRITSTVTISQRCHLEGEHNAVYILGSGIGAGVPLLDIDGEVNPNLEDVVVRNLTLIEQANTADLMHVTRVAASTFENIRLRGGNRPLVYDGDRTYLNRFMEVHVVVPGTGAGLTASPNGGQHHFANCTFGGATGVNWTGAVNRYADSITFLNCNFENCVGQAVSIGSPTDIQGFQFIGCRFEKAGAGPTILANLTAPAVLSGLVVQGCFFETDAELWAIQFNGLVSGYHIAGNVFKDYSQGAVRWNGAGSRGVVVSNYCINCAITDAFRNDFNAVFNNYSATTAGATLALIPDNVKAYNLTNVATLRAGDTDTLTTAQLADIVGTLIADLRALGLCS